MSLVSVDKLGHHLVRLELVTQTELADCVDELRGRKSSPEDLLHLMERRQILTSYQAGKILRDEAGSLVLGRYTLQYRNGAGSFARVFRAKSRDTGEMVGIKLLRQRYSQNPQSVAEFHREAELVRTLSHRNIVPIYEVGQAGNKHYFSMEFIEGGNLRELIRIRKQLSPNDATHSVMDMACGLEYALGCGFTHRDLKMTNVLLSSTGVAKLVDFGLAGGKLHLNHEPGESSARALEYATLEKATRVSADDPRSDLFFLGAIYYELLTGVAPFGKARERSERAQISRYRDIHPIEQVAPRLPASVIGIVNKLLRFNPTSRFQRPTDVVADLHGVLQELNKGKRRDKNETESISKRPANVRTVMCIENRAKQQDDLRSYFSRHGYRVLVLNDLKRGLGRLKTDPPDCMVIMAESVGNGAAEGFREAAKLRNGWPMVTVLVLPKDEADRQDQFEQSPTEKVLVQPISLRELRTLIDDGLNNKQVAGD